jgi:hypothetical protein
MQPVQAQQHPLLMALQQQQHGDAMDVDMPALARVQMQMQQVRADCTPLTTLLLRVPACGVLRQTLQTASSCPSWLKQHAEVGAASCFAMQSVKLSRQE